MSFDCRTWNTVAEHLVSSAPTGLDEACWRAAIGRSYYCVYGLASRLLVFEGVPAGTVKKHSEVREQFRSHRQKDRAMIGENLSTLLGEREKADYYHKETITREKAETAYLLASKTIVLLDRLLQPYAGISY